MNEDNIIENNKVKTHYEMWPFPGNNFLSHESLLLLRYMQRLLKVGRSNGTKSRVIDIGCGTGQTTNALAKYFPETNFLGIDISRRSLKIARTQAKISKISNVQFRNMDIRKDVLQIGKFSVALCFGVLHHIKDIRSAFKNVATLVAEDGFLVLWIYGRFGRLKHNLNQSFIKLLTKGYPVSERLSITRAFLEDLGPTFVVNSGFYTPKGSGKEGIAWLLANTQWLMDQMIPAFEHCVSMRDILELFNDNHLEFVKWLGVPIRLNTFTTSKLLLKHFKKLSPKEKLLAIDYLSKPAYYLVIGKKTIKC